MLRFGNSQQAKFIASLTIIIGSAWAAWHFWHLRHDDVTILVPQTFSAKSLSQPLGARPSNKLAPTDALPSPSISFDLSKNTDASPQGASASVKPDATIQAIENLADGSGQVPLIATKPIPPATANLSKGVRPAVIDEPGIVKRPVGDFVAALPSRNRETNPLSLEDYLNSANPLLQVSAALRRLNPSPPVCNPRMTLKGLSASNDPLISWAENWQSAVESGYGKPVQPSDPKLLLLLQKTTLPCETLYSLGRAFGFVYGDEVAAPFYEAAVTSAERLPPSFLNATTQPAQGDVAGIRRALAGIGYAATTRLHDYSLGVRVYELLQSFPSNALKMGYQIRLAYALCLGHSPSSTSKAIDLLQSIINEVNTASDGHLLLQAQIALGQVLMNRGDAQQTAYALQPLADATDNPDDGIAQVILIQAYAKSGHLDTATTVFNNWSQRHKTGRYDTIKTEITQLIGQAASLAQPN